MSGPNVKGLGSIGSRVPVTGARGGKNVESWFYSSELVDISRLSISSIKMESSSSSSSSSSSIPAESAAPERAFSGGKRVMKVDRLSLTGERASNLITEYVRYKLSRRQPPRDTTLPSWVKVPVAAGAGAGAGSQGRWEELLSAIPRLGAAEMDAFESHLQWVEDLAEGPHGEGVPADEVQAAASEEDELEEVAAASKAKRKKAGATSSAAAAAAAPAPASTKAAGGAATAAKGSAKGTATAAGAGKKSAGARK